MEEKLSWDEYFMKMAELVAIRSSCLHPLTGKGAIVVRDNHVLASGYNGAPRGLQHCTEIGCMRDKLNISSGERTEVCRGCHSEQNVLVQAARVGVSVLGGTIYTTHQPCTTCAKMIINAGIVKVFYHHPYNDPLSISLFEESDVKLIKI